MNKIDEILTRYVDKVYPSKEAFIKKLKTGDKIRMYIGIDPTGPDLHLGHTTNFLLLKKFQELGHKVIIVAGDFTARIGDPTDKLSQRQPLTAEETVKNALTYKEQISKFLDFKSKENPAEMVFNSSWLDKLTYKELIHLASHFTVQQMLERDMFQERLKQGKPISMHEFLYPISVGYDCVVLDVDLEVGGTDQTFNMLIGRDLMRDIKSKEKFVITTPLLINPKTDKKIMSKSEGSFVAVRDESKEMFGKIMALPDEVILPIFEYCTEISLKDIKKLEKELADGMNPRDAKVTLGKEIVQMYHGQKKADEAEKAFIQVFAKKENPDEMAEMSVLDKNWPLAELLEFTKLTSSKSEARRMIEQGGVKVDGAVIGDREATIRPKTGMVIQAGKRKFIKIKLDK